MEDGEDRLGNVPGPCLGGHGKGGLLLAWPALGARGGQPRVRGRTRRTARRHMIPQTLAGVVGPLVGPYRGSSRCL